MARIAEPDAAAEAAWKAWLAERPEAVRKVAERFDPWSLYRLKTTGQRVVVYSFSEGEGEGEGEGDPVTLTVVVSGQFNFVIHDRRVFGINPDDLEPCDLPGDGERLGTVLTEPKQIEAYLQEVARRNRGGG